MSEKTEIKEGDTVYISGPETQSDAFAMHEFGLTKREYFAAAALTGGISGALAHCGEIRLTEAAKDAVRTADALIAELNREAGE